MTQQEEPAEPHYPIGRGYGHDYMRGGEVFGGYGYSAREEYERPRGEQPPETRETRDAAPETPEPPQPS